MKRFLFTLSLVLAVMMANAQVIEKYKYDVNKDGTINVTDVTWLVNKILGVSNPEVEWDTYYYDINIDHSVNVTDVTWLVNKLLGIANPESYEILELSTYSLVLVSGDQATVEIKKGNGSYSVTSNKPQVAMGEINLESIVVSAIGKGTARLQVEDLVYSMGYSYIEVTVLDPLEISTNTLVLKPGTVGTVNITSGSGNYTTETSDYHVAEATIAGNNVSVSANGEGKATITLKDTGSGMTVTIEVEVTYCPDNNHPHMIDLGLPSGTKWSCCNVGAQSPLEYGNYYAWGELEPKDSYTWSNYVHRGESNEQCIFIGENIDGTDYDVAHVLWGGDWRMPNDDQVKELLNLRFQGEEGEELVQKVTLDGVNGYRFIGTNGNAIFIPAGGYFDGDRLRGENEEGDYFLSMTLSEPYAQDLIFQSKGVSLDISEARRWFGLNVRPVSSAALLQLAESSIILRKESSERVFIISGSGSYSAVSSNTDVATVEVDAPRAIWVNGVDAGTATITVTDTEGGQTATLEVTVVGPMELAKNNLSLFVDDVETVEIISGSGDYSVFSYKTSIATATIVDNSVKVFAVDEGSTSLVVSDNLSGNVITVPVSVEYLPVELEVNSLTIPLEDEMAGRVVHVISGYGNYSVKSSNNDVAYANVQPNSNELLVYGGYPGTATLTVTDTRSKKTATLEVIVEVPPFELSTTSLNLTYGTNGEVDIISGSGGFYRVKSNNTNVATAELQGNKIIITPVGAGETTVEALDLPNQKTISINVTVEYLPLTLSANTLDFSMPVSKTVEITSGNGYYSIENSATSVATADLRGSTVTVTSLGNGTATITVTDMKSGQTQAIQVTADYHLCPDDNHPHLIDLGLPSGTKWSCCNVGGDNPSGSGSSYGWGNTTAGGNELVKFSYSIAGSSLDAATVNVGPSWQMPTDTQFEELMANSTCKMITYNGAKGMLFYTSNGSAIFFYTGDKLTTKYWSATPQAGSASNAFDFIINSTGTCQIGNNQRVDLCYIRPVENTNPVGDVPALKLSMNSVDVKINDYARVDITSGSGYYMCSSSNTNYAEVLLWSNNGNPYLEVKGIAVGDVSITVTDVMSGQTVTIPVYFNFLCPDENHPHAVDLGLPSGTKWSCCNVGSEIPHDHGGYYAWGETETKSDYSSSTYTYDNTLYNGDITGTIFDAAYVNMGRQWQMPSLEQIEELIDNCSSERTTYHGVNGMLLTRNDKSIFLPDAGFYYGQSITPGGSYWSSTLDDLDPSRASYFYLSSSLSDGSSECYMGMNVRPVTNPNTGTIPNLQLAQSKIEMTMGDQKTVEITSGSGKYIAYTDREYVSDIFATAVIENNTVVITGIGDGPARIIVKDLKSGQTKSIEVSVFPFTLDTYSHCPDGNHPHKIDLGLPSGILWSCCNVGATAPEECGNYYAWGETTTKERYEDYNYLHGEEVLVEDDPDTEEDETGNITGSEYDAAHVVMGGTWVMPSLAQVEELVSNCRCEQTYLNGVGVMKFTSRDDEDKYIYLPYTGYMEGDYRFEEGSGYYWLNQMYTTWPAEAYYFTFNNWESLDYYYAHGGKQRKFGMTIRPVSK